MRKAFLSIIIIAFLLGGCHSDNSSDFEQAPIVMTSLPVDMNESQEPEVQQKLIKQADLRFSTDDMGLTRTMVFGLIHRHQAYIAGETSSMSSFEISEKIAIKVPSRNFDSLMTALAQEVQHFDAKEIRVTDVTSEYIDLQARINNKEVLEQRFLNLLDKTDSIEELLRIEKKVAEVREEIERAEARLNYLSRKVSYSEVNVEFYKSLEVAPTFGAEISAGFRNGWEYLKNIAIGLANVWPFLLALLVGWLLIRERKLLFFRQKA